MNINNIHLHLLCAKFCEQQLAKVSNKAVKRKLFKVLTEEFVSFFQASCSVAVKSKDELRCIALPLNLYLKMQLEFQRGTKLVCGEKSDGTNRMIIRDDRGVLRDPVLDVPVWPLELLLAISSGTEQAVSELGEAIAHAHSRISA